MYVGECNIILPLYSHYFYSLNYRVVEEPDDNCLEFIIFEWEYDVEYNICRYENCPPVTTLGISTV